MANVFSVETFKSALGAGGARPNQFMISFLGGPVGPLDGILVSSASLPGQILQAAVVQYRGREVKMAGDRIFAPWTTTFINDTGFVAREYVESWMQVMEDRRFKVGATVPDSYYGQMMATQLDRNGEMLYSYTFTDAFPSDISEVQLDYGLNDQVSTFTVTWQYQQFEINNSGIAAFF